MPLPLKQSDSFRGRSDKNHHLLTIRMSYTVLFMTSSLLHSLFPRFIDAKDNSSNIRDYCQWEKFNASCSPGSLIHMTSARYGRMRVGRCLTSDHQIGCAQNVLLFSDSRCSGHTSCQFNVLDPDLFTKQTCSQEVVPYLSASYRCLKMQQLQARTCRLHGYYELSSISGFVASAQFNTTASTALRPCQLILSAHPGRTINVTLFDYALWRTTSEQRAKVGCQRYVTISEPTHHRSSVVCGGGAARERQIYLSRSNRIIIDFANPSSHNNFVLHYNHLGCEDLEPPIWGWVRRSGSMAVAGCNSSSALWHLVCRDNDWVGRLGNCTQGHLQTIEERKVDDDLSSHGVLVAISIGVAVGICFGVLLLILLAYFQRRNSRRRRNEAEMYLTEDRTVESLHHKSDISRGSYRELPSQVCSCRFASESALHSPLTSLPDCAIQAAIVPEQIYVPRRTRTLSQRELSSQKAAVDFDVMVTSCTCAQCSNYACAICTAAGDNGTNLIREGLPRKAQSTHRIPIQTKI